ncbi:disease resistance protein RPP8-like [Chenopodium quinoa]|nr:disease resistance protein RPP8-like [Chenopodium quinoa]
MSSRLQAYGIQSSYSMYNHSSLVANRKFLAEERRTYPHVGDKEVVGLDESVSKLMDTLSRDGQHAVVVVHGMGGIGKTTLGREVFKHSNIKDHFDDCAWTYVSQQPQQRRL